MRIVPGKKRAWFPWIVVGLLVVHTSGMLLAVYIAIGDHTFVPVPDYYGKAIRWDQTRAESRASDLLGWKRKIGLSKPDQNGARTLHVRVVDRDERAVIGLNAGATLFPELHPNQTREIVMDDKGNGLYTSVIRNVQNGPLVIDLRATRNRDTFITRAVLYVGGGS